MPFQIEIVPIALGDTRFLTSRERATLFKIIPVQLKHQPDIETKNRKKMRSNPIAPWELRVDRMRVYYEFVLEPEPWVTVLRIGVKEGHRIWIGGEEFIL